MSHLRLYLWKEWRDQRAGTLGVVCALPLLLALAGVAALLGQRGFFREALRPGVAAAFGALLALFVVGTELLPGERRRRTLRFLERVPGSLGAAFTAKLLYFALSTALAAVYAAAVAASIRFLWEGRWPADAFGRGWSIEAAWILPAMGLSLWLFSVSAWVPRGTLAFPAAVLCIAVLGWPAWVLFGGVERLRPFEWEPPAFLLVCALGACASAWASFVLGARRGGSHARSALLGLGAAALVLAPSWAWTALRIDAHVNLDPASDDFRIQGVRLLDDGRRAEVWACRELPWLDRVQGSKEGPTHALVADLATGAFERATDEGEDARALALFRPRADVERFPWAYAGFERARERLLAARQRPVPDHAGRRERLRAFPRRLPEAEELGLAQSASVWRWLGLGFRVTVDGPRGERDGVFDPFACRFTSFAELARLGFGRGHERLWVGPRGWLVADDEAHRAYRWAPGTPWPGQPLRAFAYDDRVVGVLEDGGVLACGEGRAFVVDLERDERAEVAFADGSRPRIDALCDPVEGLRPLGFIAPAVVLVTGPEGNALARFDASTRTLHPTRRVRAELLLAGAPDADHVLAVEERRRIVRLAFDGAGREVLFPRPDAAP